MTKAAVVVFSERFDLPPEIKQKVISNLLDSGQIVLEPRRGKIKAYRIMKDGRRMKKSDVSVEEAVDYIRKCLTEEITEGRPDCLHIMLYAPQGEEDLLRVTISIYQSLHCNIVGESGAKRDLKNILELITYWFFKKIIMSSKSKETYPLAPIIEELANNLLRLRRLRVTNIKFLDDQAVCYEDLIPATANLESALIRSLAIDIKSLRSGISSRLSISYRSLNALILRNILKYGKLIKDPDIYQLLRGNLLDALLNEDPEPETVESMRIDVEEIYKQLTRIIGATSCLISKANKYFRHRCEEDIYNKSSQEGVFDALVKYLKITRTIYRDYVENILFKIIDEFITGNKGKNYSNQVISPPAGNRGELIDALEANLTKIFVIYDIIFLPNLFFIANLFPLYAFIDPIVIISQGYNFITSRTASTYSKLIHLIYFLFYSSNSSSDIRAHEIKKLKEVWKNEIKNKIPETMVKLLNIRWNQEEIKREVKEQLSTMALELYDRISNFEEYINQLHMRGGKGAYLIGGEKMIINIPITRLRHILNITHGFIPRGMVSLNFTTAKIISKEVLESYLKFQTEVVNNLLADTTFGELLKVKLTNSYESLTSEDENSELKEISQAADEIFTNLRDLLKEYNDKIIENSIKFVKRMGDADKVVRCLDLLWDFLPEILLTEAPIECEENGS